MKQKLGSILRRHRFGILLASLLGMIIYAPLTELIAPQVSPFVTRILLGGIFAWLTIGAVYAVSTERRAPLVAVVLGTLLLVAELADLALLRSDTHVWSHFFAILFMGHIVIVLFRYIFNVTQVDTNTIFASLCVYLLLGVLWALVYSLLEQAQPGAFFYSQANEHRMRFGSEGTSTALYFSFVTITTLGYGDIAPVSEAARALATVQAICGQLYLTVLVAWLVGLHIAHSRVDRSETEP